MKYFIKYLLVQDPKGARSGDRLVSIMDCNPIGPNIAQIYRPFFCSRDVQVGDMVRSDSYDSDISIEYRLNAGNLKACSLLGIQHTLFKVLGPVSPKATWVKEGDEYIAEDLCWALHDDFGEFQEECALENIVEAGENDYIMVICPTCQTYH